MTYSIQIDEKRLLKAIDSFGKNVVKNVSLEIKKGAVLVQESARGRHRFVSRTGNLERSTETKHELLRSLVGINKTFAHYGKYIHDGTKPYTINPKDKKVLRFVGNGGFSFAKSVKHPGLKADPYITNAGKRESGKIKDNIYKAIKKASEVSFG